MLMKKRVLGAIAVGMLIAAIAVPAGAATSGISEATVTVEAGFLAITVPEDAGNLGSRTNTVGGGTISGPSGQVQVNDARSAAAGSGWVTSVISTAFTPPVGRGDRRQRGWLHRRNDHQGRHRDLHREQPRQSSRLLRRQSRRPGSPGTTPLPGTRRSPWTSPAGTGRRHLLGDHHPLCCLETFGWP